jgi:hypothetical protein
MDTSILSDAELVIQFPRGQLLEAGLVRHPTPFPILRRDLPQDGPPIPFLPTPDGKTYKDKLPNCLLATVGLATGARYAIMAYSTPGKREGLLVFLEGEYLGLASYPI